MIKILLIMILLLNSLIAHASQCTPTPHRTTGTHYEPVTVAKINVSQGVTVQGKILAAPGCEPVSDAKIAHWQAGENGRYQDKLRAYLFSDKVGKYAFETEWPNLSPPHIHFIVSKEGYQVLETQWIGDTRKNHIEFNMVLEKSSN